MSISVKDRKMLWALSKNKCAICSCPLVEKSSDANIIIGEECHIVSAKQNGPRHRHMINYDIFDNLILLCPKHHKIIDEDVKTYTEDKLLKLKHISQGFVVNDKENEFIVMYKVDNAIELFNYINEAEQYAKKFPIDCKNDYQLFKEFYDIIIKDFDLMNGEIDEIETNSLFGDIFVRLDEKGYCVLATVIDNFEIRHLRTAFVYIMKKSDLIKFRYKSS